jgi:hypothetical protein
MVFLIHHIQWINSHSLDGLDNKENICLIRISKGSSKAYFYGKEDTGYSWGESQSFKFWSIFLLSLIPNYLYTKHEVTSHDPESSPFIDWKFKMKKQYLFLI